MSRSEQGPRLVFRIQREDQSGTTSEERELVGLTADELMKYLCAPWETAPEGEGRSATDSVDALAESIARYFRDLQLVVTEQQTDPNTRMFTLGFRRASEATKTERASKARVKKGEKSPVQLGGKLQFQVRSDEGGGNVICDNTYSRIDVNNRALLLLHKNNVYANVHVQFYLTINSG